MITFDEWRDNLYDEEGEVLIEDVLFVRATEKDFSLVTPVFEETDREIADTKLLLVRRLQDAR